MKNWILLSFVLVTAVLQTGCADIGMSPYLSPTTIHTSFDSVQVRIAKGTLHVTLQSAAQNLQHLHIDRASYSTSTNSAKLTLSETVFDPANPHQVELVFVPAPTPPFSINLATKVDGHAMYLRADFFGSHSITY